MSSTEAKDIMINYSVLALTRVLSHLEKSTSGEFSGDLCLTKAEVIPLAAWRFCLETPKNLRRFGFSGKSFLVIVEELEHGEQLSF